MNTDTGKIYTGENEIAAARKRGERLALVSERAAQLVTAAREQKLRDLSALCICSHKARHHFAGSRRRCKYRSCSCLAFVEVKGEGQAGAGRGPE